MCMLGDGYFWGDFCVGKIDRDCVINESFWFDFLFLVMFCIIVGKEEIVGW